MVTRVVHVGKRKVNIRGINLLGSIFVELTPTCLKKFSKERWFDITFSRFARGNR
jgi:hypothetical protein